jgi:hypothetical protein
MARSVSAQGVASRAPQGRPAAIAPGDQVFSLREVAVISGWFRENRGHLPPNLMDRDPVPPGLLQQIQKNSKLPPSLEKKAQPMPAALEKQLVVLPKGYRRVVIGNSIVALSPAGVVLDIARDVIL